MKDRYGIPQEESATARAIDSTLNLVAVIFARIYFPSFSNGLQEIGDWLGFAWSEANASGLYSILWRHRWEMSDDNPARERLIIYNSEDCQALEVVAHVASQIGEPQPTSNAAVKSKEIVSVDSLKSLDTMWPKFKSPFPEFEEVNKAARWTYQRDRIYVRSSSRIRHIAQHKQYRAKRLVPVNKQLTCADQFICPECSSRGIKPSVVTTRVVHDLLFGKASLKRWVVEYRFHWHWCPQCRRRFGEPKNCWRKTKFGRNLVAYVLYRLIELHIPQMVVQKELKRLYGYELNVGVIAKFKAQAAEYYAETVRLILARLRGGAIGSRG